MNPLRVSGQISANQREGKAETNAKVNKHWKTRAKSNDVIPIIISSNQHFASIFSLEIFKFQRHSCKLSFSSRPAARAPRRACSCATKLDLSRFLQSFVLEYTKIKQAKEGFCRQGFVLIQTDNRSFHVFFNFFFQGGRLRLAPPPTIQTSVNFRNFAELYLRSLRMYHF